MTMKNTSKFTGGFPRPLRDDSFIQKNNGAQNWKANSGALTRRRTVGVVSLGFLLFSAWNFLALRTLLGLVEWNLSVFRCAGVAVLASFWLVVTWSLLNARSK